MGHLHNFCPLPTLSRKHYVPPLSDITLLCAQQKLRSFYHHVLKMDNLCKHVSGLFVLVWNTAALWTVLHQFLQLPLFLRFFFLLLLLFSCKNYIYILIYLYYIQITRWPMAGQWDGVSAGFDEAHVSSKPVSELLAELWGCDSGLRGYHCSALLFIVTLDLSRLTSIFLTLCPLLVFCTLLS